MTSARSLMFLTLKLWVTSREKAVLQFQDMYFHSTSYLHVATGQDVAADALVARRKKTIVAVYLT